MAGDIRIMEDPKAEDNAIQEVIDSLPNKIDVDELYRQFIGLSNIERVHEEDYVIRELIRGRPQTEIMNTLRAKYPDNKFTPGDMEKFLARNKEVAKAMGKELTMSARRHLEAKAQCSEMIAGLALYTQKLIQDFRAEGDNTNTVAAIRALNTTVENYMKLEGMIGNQNEGGKVINVINTMSETKIPLKDRIHNANFITIKDDEDI
jgi:hypothetical protein